MDPKHIIPKRTDTQLAYYYDFVESPQNKDGQYIQNFKNTYYFAYSKIHLIISTEISVVNRKFRPQQIFQQQLNWEMRKEV